jgi:hypothetical protein
MDESHHFLLSRDSNSFIDLFKNTRYDGHPILWNYLIHLITKFSTNPFYMQFLHISISSLVVFIFLKKTPFNTWFKITFLLSYFILYEYTVISRNYNLGVLFLFLACSLYSKKKANFTSFCLFLALSCNTHSIFIIVSTTLLFSVFVEQFFKNEKEIFKYLWKGYTIFFVGVVIAFYQIIPPSNSIFFSNVDYANRILNSSMSLFKALFPVVDFTNLKYWNHFYFIEHFRFLSAIIGILVWVLPLLFFNKNKYILLFVYTTLLGFVAFEITTSRYGIRYNGLLFITFVVGFWMANTKENNSFIKMNLSQFNTKIIGFLMLIQASSGILAYSLDIKYTFNNGKKVAKYIKEQKLDLNTIMTACESASINAFLPENLYNLAYQKNQGYYLWNQNLTSFYKQTDEQIIDLGFQNNPSKKKLYFIVQELISVNSIQEKKYKISLTKRFENAVKENYYLYLIEKNE